MIQTIGIAIMMVLIGAGCAPDASTRTTVAGPGPTSNDATFLNQIEQLERRNLKLEEEISNYRNAAIVVREEDGWMVEKSDIWVPVELLEDLPKEWEMVEIQRANGLFLITHMFQDGRDQEDTIKTSHAMFPSLTTEDELQGYAYFVWTDHPFESNLYGTVHTIEPRILTPVTTFYWQKVFAFCSSKILPYEGVLAIACATGDNGCFTEDRVKINVFDGTYVRAGVCTNSCDLGPTDTYRITCK